MGWFAYAPLTETPFSRGHSTDYWILSILLASVGSTATAINLIATAFSMRCPGMTLNKMPVLVWLAVVDAWMMLVALPPLSAAQIMLLLDRYLGAHFFDTQAGGSALLWQHFFWIFGHPEVYILVIPAFGIRLGDNPGLFAQSDFWLRSDGRGVMRDRVYQPGRVGASHVRGRHDAGGQCVFRHVDDAGGDSRPGSRFSTGSGQCGADAFGCRVPMLFAIAFLFQFLIAGPDRDHAGGGAVRLAAHRYLFRRRAFPLRINRWNRLHDFRRYILLVPKGDWAKC